MLLYRHDILFIIVRGYKVISYAKKVSVCILHINISIRGKRICPSQLKNLPDNLIFLKPPYPWHLTISPVSAHAQENV